MSFKQALCAYCPNTLRTCFVSLFVSVASVAMVGNAQAVLMLRGEGLITSSGIGNGGTYKLIYDDVLDITWLDLTVPSASWFTQHRWADDLTVLFNGQTLDNWRLPQTLPVDGSLPYDFTWSVNGSTDVGYNISAPGGAYPGSTGSEMAHLYYTSLGNLGKLDPSGNLQVFPPPGLTNKGPFDHLYSNNIYWSFTGDTGGEYWNLSYRAFSFFFPYGSQDWEASTENFGLALAVLPGDVVPIPEPKMYALMLIGLCVVGLAANKRKQYAA